MMRIKGRYTLQYEVLSQLKADSPTHRMALHSRFDPHKTGKLNPILLALNALGLIAYDPDGMVIITSSGLAVLEKRLSLVTAQSISNEE